MIQKLNSIAIVLNARVLGDDEEIYMERDGTPVPFFSNQAGFGQSSRS